jgi:ribokinase
MQKILVAGSINMDIVAKIEHLPRPGETVFGDELHYIPGGKGSNQAVAASRLGKNVYLIGKLGQDIFGDSLATILEEEQLNLEYLFYSKSHPSGVALINVDKQSENSITVISGSNFQLSEQDVEQCEINEGDVVVSVFEIPQSTIKHLFKKANLANAKTILNPALAKLIRNELLETVDYLIINETELAFYTNQKKVNEDIETITQYASEFRMRPSQTIIITLGSKGAICISGEDVIYVPGIKVEAIDTTGAGDCFTGAFEVAVSEQMLIDQAIIFANKAASLSVQKLGASTSMPYRQQVEDTL